MHSASKLHQEKQFAFSGVLFFVLLAMFPTNKHLPGPHVYEAFSALILPASH